MEIGEIIDRAKAAIGAESDSALSRHLGLSRTAVGNWRSGVSLPDPVSCERLAGLTGIPLARVLGIVGEARAHSREEKAVWRKLAASATLLALVVMGNAQEGVYAATQPSIDAAKMYIMRNRGGLGKGLRYLGRILRDWLGFALGRARKPEGSIEVFTWI